MTISKTRKESYLSYLLMELLVVAIITSVFVAFVIFYLVGNAERKRKESPMMNFIFDNPMIYAGACLLVALIAVILTIYFRNRNYVIGYEFDDDQKVLTLLCRKLKRNSENTLSLHHDEISIATFKERKFILNQVYFGVKLTSSAKTVRADFVRNNFIWEKQPREKIHFLEQIEKITGEKLL